MNNFFYSVINNKIKMWWYLAIAAVIIVMILILYFCIPSEDYKENDISKKIEDLVKTDLNKAREVAKNDLQVFEALQNANN